MAQRPPPPWMTSWDAPPCSYGPGHGAPPSPRGARGERRGYSERPSQREYELDTCNIRGPERPGYRPDYGFEDEALDEPMDSEEERESVRERQ